MQDKKSITKSVNRAYFALMEQLAISLRRNGADEEDILEAQIAVACDRDMVLNLVDNHFDKKKGNA